MLTHMIDVYASPLIEALLLSCESESLHIQSVLARHVVFGDA